MHSLDLFLDAFNGLEVFDSLDMELCSSVLVNDDESPWMQLERREGPKVVDSLFDCLGERKGLALAGDNDNDLARLEHGGDADGESHARDSGDIVVEETSVGENGVVRERLDARARGEGGA